MRILCLCCHRNQHCDRDPLTLQGKLVHTWCMCQTAYVAPLWRSFSSASAPTVLKQHRVKQPRSQRRSRKQQLTRILSSVFPFLVSILMPRTNFMDDLSIIFLMLSVDDNINICYDIVSLSFSRLKEQTTICANFIAFHIKTACKLLSF